MEKSESFTEAVKREVFEETGLLLEKVKLSGMIDWIHDTGARWIVLLYESEHFSGTLIDGSKEGKVCWMEKETLRNSQVSMNFTSFLRIYDDQTAIEGIGKWVDDTLENVADFL